MKLNYSPLAHDFPDRSIRDSLKQPENLRDFLMDAIPDIASHLDFSKATQVDREFLIKDDWRKRESDLLFLIPYRDGDVESETLICILIEHQSQADSRMPLRLLIYAVLYWERQWSEWNALPTPRPEFRVTPIVPIVLHTGERPWSTNRCMADLFDGPQLFREFAPNWPVTFWDLAEKPTRALLDAGGAWLKALALIRAGDDDEATFLAVMDEALAELERMAEREEVRWTDLLQFMLCWAARLRPNEERERLTEQVRDSHQSGRVKEELKSMKTTIATSIFHEGEVAGEARGQLASARTMLMDNLEIRFGHLPIELIDWVHGEVDIERLRDFNKRAVTASSLAELGTPTSV